MAVTVSSITRHTHTAMQAVERAISELTRLQKPLQTESDVAELSMGARSKEKVLEILETGTLRRNAVLAGDQQQQVIQLVSIVHCISQIGPKSDQSMISSSCTDHRLQPYSRTAGRKG